jgi:hypothetical protein
MFQVALQTAANSIDGLRNICLIQKETLHIIYNELNIGGGNSYVGVLLVTLIMIENMNRATRNVRREVLFMKCLHSYFVAWSDFILVECLTGYIHFNVLQK